MKSGCWNSATMRRQKQWKIWVIRYAKHNENIFSWWIKLKPSESIWPIEQANSTTWRWRMIATEIALSSSNSAWQPWEGLKRLHLQLWRSSGRKMKDCGACCKRIQKQWLYSERDMIVCIEPLQTHLLSCWICFAQEEASLTSVWNTKNHK